jgi:hypothetical protein
LVCLAFYFLLILYFHCDAFCEPFLSISAAFFPPEVDYKWKLLVRPWALLPFALTAALVVRLVTGLW